MRNRGLILLIILLLLILILEGLAVAGMFDRFFYPSSYKPVSSQTTSTTSTETSDESSQESSASLIGTRVYDVTAQAVIPAGSSGTSYRETQLVTATPSADGRSISIDGSDSQSPTNRSIARIQIERDGSYFLTYFEASDAQGSFSCEGSVPGYLAVGRDTAEASLDCSVDGTPATTFTGTATASAPTPYDFQGTTYQARTTTVSGSFGTTVAQGLEFVAAPGIGTLEIHGSLGDLVFGSLLGPVSGETQSVLVESDNNTLFQAS